MSTWAYRIVKQRLPDRYQRNSDGVAINHFTNLPLTVHGPIPLATHFYHNYSFEIPERVFGWNWSPDFNRWSALVQFKDGWFGYTFPQEEDK